MEFRIKEMLHCQFTLMAGVTMAQTLVPGAEITIIGSPNKTAAVGAYLLCREEGNRL